MTWTQVQVQAQAHVHVHVHAHAQVQVQVHVHVHVHAQAQVHVHAQAQVQVQVKAQAQAQVQGWALLLLFLSLSAVSAAGRHPSLFWARNVTVCVLVGSAGSAGSLSRDGAACEHQTSLTSAGCLVPVRILMRPSAGPDPQVETR